MPLLDVLNFHRLIEQDVQKLGFYVYDHLEPEEVDLQINRQEYFLMDGILDIYFGRELKVDQNQGFQRNQVTLDNLRRQHVKDATMAITEHDEGKKFEIPDNYYHKIKVRVKVSYPCWEGATETTKTVWVKVRFPETEDIDELKLNPLHKTTWESPLGQLAGNTIYVYNDDTFNIVEAKLDYIKKPSKITYVKDINGNYDPDNSVQCDLDDSLHYMLQKMTSVEILHIIEAMQQKVVNLKQQLT